MNKPVQCLAFCTGNGESFAVQGGRKSGFGKWEFHICKLEFDVNIEREAGAAVGPDRKKLE